MSQKLHNSQSITIQNRTADCKKLFDFLISYLSSNDIKENIHHDLKLIIEETFTNITSYAHEKNPEKQHEKKDNHKITVELNSDSETISITFTDKGVAFNPITACDKNIETTDPCEGGMGIHIIKSLSDHLDYKRIEQCNVFTVTKHYTKQQ